MIPLIYRINDSRCLKDLTKSSFSGFSIKDVVKAFENALNTCKVEEAVNWGIEILFSGQPEKFWEKIFSISSKNININNPRLANFLFKRYSRYVSLKHKYAGGTDNLKSSNEAGYLSMRNSQIIRNLLCEVTVIICNSTKLKTLSLPKIKESEFNLDFIKTKIIADLPNLVFNKLKYGDPDELKIPLNEFNFCIRTRKWELSVYWLAWILEWERRNTKRDKYYICGFRKIENIDDRSCSDVIWIIWEIIIKEAIDMKNSDVSEQIFSLFKLYKFDFKPSKKSKRVCFILYAIKYFTEIYSFKHDIIHNYYQLVQACSNINIMCYDKRRFEVQKHKNTLETHAYNGILQNTKNSIQQKLEKGEIKKLKQIADMKIKNKIETVEMIDSLILSNYHKKNK